jgi:hypothetical protein
LPTLSEYFPVCRGIVHHLLMSGSIWVPPIVETSPNIFCIQVAIIPLPCPGGQQMFQLIWLVTIHSQVQPPKNWSGPTHLIFLGQNQPADFCTRYPEKRLHKFGEISRTTAGYPQRGGKIPLPFSASFFGNHRSRICLGEHWPKIQPIFPPENAPLRSVLTFIFCGVSAIWLKEFLALPPPNIINSFTRIHYVANQIYH